MTNSARNAAQRARTTARRVSQGMAAVQSRKAHSGAHAADRAEGVILRMAGVASADVAQYPSTRPMHQAHIAGAIEMALNMGMLTDQRALQLRQACIELLDGARRATPGQAAPDPAFASMVTAVRRHGGASLNEPLGMAELPAGRAAQMLARLIAAQVVDTGDVHGFHRVTKGDC